jgi:hypothetical protein
VQFAILGPVEAHRPDGTPVALGGPQLRGIIPQSRAFAWFNTRMIKLMPYLPGRNRVLEQMSRPIREAANALVLMDYSLSAGGRVPSS